MLRNLSVLLTLLAIALSTGCIVEEPPNEPERPVDCSPQITHENANVNTFAFGDPSPLAVFYFDQQRSKWPTDSACFRLTEATTTLRVRNVTNASLSFSFLIDFASQSSSWWHQDSVYNLAPGEYANLGVVSRNATALRFTQLIVHLGEIERN